MIEFSCGHCGLGFKVADGLAGQQVSCPQCHSAIMPPSVSAPQIVTTRAPTLPAKQMPVLPWIIVGILASLLVVTASVAVFLSVRPQVAAEEVILDDNANVKVKVDEEKPPIFPRAFVERAQEVNAEADKEDRPPLTIEPGSFIDKGSIVVYRRREAIGYTVSIRFRNISSQAVESVAFKLAYRDPKRLTPWLERDMFVEIEGGIEPNETRSVTDDIDQATFDRITDKYPGSVWSASIGDSGAWVPVSVKDSGNANAQAEFLLNLDPFKAGLDQDERSQKEPTVQVQNER